MTAYDIHNPPMMACGHAANATKVTADGDIPCCVIDGCTAQVEAKPDLTGRTAKCSTCSNTAASRWGLAFFEYLGPGSTTRRVCGAVTIEATGRRCGFYEEVHQAINPGTGRPGITDHPFEARPLPEKDRYYCGCRGWD